MVEPALAVYKLLLIMSQTRSPFSPIPPPSSGLQFPLHKLVYMLRQQHTRMCCTVKLPKLVTRHKSIITNQYFSFEMMLCNNAL